MDFIMSALAGQIFS